MPAPTPSCGECLREPPAFERCITLADYVPPWPELIAAYKYRQQIDLAAALADSLGDALDRAPDAAGPAAPLVVPVPLSRERMHERGFNQAWEIARRIARRRGWPATATLLQRVRDTAHQTGMSRDERARNLRDAFWVDDRGRRLAGQSVALVDDVLTTGATAQAAALALRRAGASAVELWVLTRTPLEPA